MVVSVTTLWDLLEHAMTLVARHPGTALQQADMRRSGRMRFRRTSGSRRASRTSSATLVTKRPWIARTTGARDQHPRFLSAVSLAASSCGASQARRCRPAIRGHLAVERGRPGVELKLSPFPSCWTLQKPAKLPRNLPKTCQISVQKTGTIVRQRPALASQIGQPKKDQPNQHNRHRHHRCEGEQTEPKGDEAAAHHKGSTSAVPGRVR